MTLGECFEVPAGVGHAVYFVETIREKRDSQSVTIAVSQNLMELGFHFALGYGNHKLES